MSQRKFAGTQTVIFMTVWYCLRLEALSRSGGDRLGRRQTSHEPQSECIRPILEQTTEEKSHRQGGSASREKNAPTEPGKGKSGDIEQSLLPE